MSENETVKSLIRELLAQGYTLSQVQTELKARGHAMTFMELRLLAAELQDIQWSAPEPPPAPAEKPAEAALLIYHEPAAFIADHVADFS